VPAVIGLVLLVSACGGEATRPASGPEASLRITDVLDPSANALYMEGSVWHVRVVDSKGQAVLDRKLFEGELDGFRYDGMPDDRRTWRLVLRGLDRAAGPGGFAAAAEPRRAAIVERFSAGDLPVEIDASRAWSVVMRAVLAAFYSHPWAWNEIGFGGPAYPRGYMRLQAGPAGREPHETAEAFGLDPVVDVPRRGLE